jgi:hypothetical protein
VLHWISERLWEFLSIVPALFVERDSPHFALARALFGLLLIVLVVHAIAIGPLRAAIRRHAEKRESTDARKR